MNSNLNIDVKILDKRLTPQMLQPKTAGSAGVDLHACLDTPLVLAPAPAIWLRQVWRYTSPTPPTPV